MSQSPSAPAAIRLDQVDALILAGGLGTRLRPVVSDRPKALAEVAGRPFLDVLLDRLAAAGVRRCVLSLGHLAAAVQAQVAHRTAPDCVCVVEPQPLGTGGALRFCLSALRSEHVLAMNGDSVVDLDFSAFLAFHLNHGEALSMACVARDDRSASGGVSLDAHGVLTQFDEKRADLGPGLINAGVYLMRREVIAAIPEGEAVSLEREVFPAYLGRARGFVASGGFLDIGTPETFAVAQNFFAERD